MTPATQAPREPAARWRPSGIPLWLLYPAALGIAAIIGVLSSLNPYLGIAALALIVGTAAFLRSGSLAVYAFTVATYFDFTTQWTGELLSPIKLVGGSLVIVAVITLAGRSQRPKWQRSPAPGWVRQPVLVGSLVCLLVLAVASAGWAQNLEQVKDLSIRLLTLAGILLAVPVFLQRTHQLRTLAWTVLGAAAASVIVGVALGATVKDRATGTFLDPNFYAAALVPAIALGLAVSESAQSAWQRNVGRVLALTCVYGIIQSESRGGLVALAVAVVMLLVTTRGAVRMRMAFAGGVVALAAAAVIAFTPAGASLIERVTSEDSSGRTDLWKVALNEFEANPLVGVGLGNFPERAPEFIESDVHNTAQLGELSAHSTPLELLAELGILGLLAFVGCVGACLYGAVRALRSARTMVAHRSGELVPLGAGLVSATVASLSTGIFLSAQYQELLWVLLGACIAYAAIVRRSMPGWRSVSS
jgi:putative inorganic carbon (hco3(-)) transporter